MITHKWECPGISIDNGMVAAEVYLAAKVPMSTAKGHVNVEIILYNILIIFGNIIIIL